MARRVIKHTVYLILLLFAESHGKQCYFRETNQKIDKCQVSEWFPWNCVCCGSNVLQQKMAMRDRGMCCSDGADMETCKSECNITASLSEMGYCADHCSYLTRTSFCSLAPAAISTQSMGTTVSYSTKQNKGVVTGGQQSANDVIGTHPNTAGSITELATTNSSNGSFQGRLTTRSNGGFSIRATSSNSGSSVSAITSSNGVLDSQITTNLNGWSISQATIPSVRQSALQTTTNGWSAIKTTSLNSGSVMRASTNVNIRSVSGAASRLNSRSAPEITTSNGALGIVFTRKNDGSAIGTTTGSNSGPVIGRKTSSGGPVIGITSSRGRPVLGKTRSSSGSTVEAASVKGGASTGTTTPNGRSTKKTTSKTTAATTNSGYVITALTTKAHGASVVGTETGSNVELEPVFEGATTHSNGGAFVERATSFSHGGILTGDPPLGSNGVNRATTHIDIGKSLEEMSNNLPIGLLFHGSTESKITGRDVTQPTNTYFLSYPDNVNNNCYIAVWKFPVNENTFGKYMCVYYIRIIY